MGAIVYLNGEYLPKEEARVSVDDRGFLLADGIYEAAPAYHGRFLRLAEHLARMARGLAAIRIDCDVTPLAEISERLLAENGLLDVEYAMVYAQVTRGAAPRTHAFPAAPPPPTAYAAAQPLTRVPRERWERGFSAVTVPDLRWGRVDIKSIALLPNVLAQQAAVDSGANDAILVRNGVALEGAHANLFAVSGGTLLTHPLTNQVLPGITRGLVLELAAEVGIPSEQRSVFLDELRAADEVFLTGTTAEIRPLVTVDGRPVGRGSVGPVARRLYAAFLETVQALVGAAR
ncbi:MAG: aminotransferase class IV [Gemmatimonadetes bacterium]|nr:aminotransferase class IV [Gemmatimonadota bacterium]